jgi:V8-like Glu-specific endopeptidase
MRFSLCSIQSSLSRVRLLRRFRHLSAPLALSLTACGAPVEGDAEPIASLEQDVYCNTNDYQNVETYTEMDGVSSDFVAAHQRSVGFFGCSGTLIGNGLFLTAAHCLPPGLTGGGTVTFNYHLDADGVETGTDAYTVAEVIEDHGSSQLGLLRLWGEPEKRYGFTPIENRNPAVDETLVLIGHPAQLSHPTFADGTQYKSVEVGQVSSVDTAIRYKHLDSQGGGSGAGLFSALSGRLVGVHNAGGDGIRACSQPEIANSGRPFGPMLAASSVLDGDRGSGHLYQVDPSRPDVVAYRLSTLRNWSSAWQEIVVGEFNGAANDDLFFYERETGMGRFYTFAAADRMQLIGSPITGLRTTWTQVLSLDINADGRSELLFYDPEAGHGSFYSTNGSGSLDHIRTLSWSKSWKQIVAGDLTSRAGPELVFYNADGINLYGTNSNGTITRIGSSAMPYDVHSLHVGGFNERTILNGDGNELLVYSGTQQLLAAFKLASDGSATELWQTPFGGGDVTSIVTGSMHVTLGTEIIAYESTNAFVGYYTTTGGSVRYVGLAAPAHFDAGKILYGRFLSGSPGQVLFYDRYRPQ